MLKIDKREKMENDKTSLHIGAKVGEIAKTVILPGDPLRAKYIAEDFLENPVCFNKVRNNLGFTGIYKGKEISVMGSGMGCPSLAIYASELYNFYSVENIIRVGTAGALKSTLKLKDIVLAEGACTDSNFSMHYNLPGVFAPIADYGLLENAVKTARNLNLNFEVGNVFSSDIFYEEDNSIYKKWQMMGVLAVEMESSALYSVAARYNKKALCILSISNYMFRDEGISFGEKEKGLNDMINLALNTAIIC